MQTKTNQNKIIQIKTNETKLKQNETTTKPKAKLQIKTN